MAAEQLQLAAIGREASWRDVSMDVLGAGLGLVLAQAVREHQNI